MRRGAQPVALHDEEEEEMEFDEDMEGLEDEMDGMTLEDLLSPEEIEMLIKLVRSVLQGDLDEVKKIIECTYFSKPRAASERLGKAGDGDERFQFFSHRPHCLPTAQFFAHGGPTPPLDIKLPQNRY